MRKLITILGAGESGIGAAILAQKMGYEVWLSDSGLIKDTYLSEINAYQIPFEQERHDITKILTSEIVIKSPGIPETIPLVQSIKEAGIKIISEIEFAAEHTKAILIGITGTNGKTTTTMLTYHLLQKAGLKVGLGGNVGQSFAKQVALYEFDYFVLELSSFQLDNMYQTALDYAVLLNITPDHLDRYPSFEDYVASKFRIAQNQNTEQKFIYCLDDQVITDYLQHHPVASQFIPFSLEKEVEEGAFIKNNNMNVSIKNPKTDFQMSVSELSLRGRHNSYNSMAAAIIANSLLIRKELIRESLSDFKNVEHRLEFVAKVKGIEFINDSKATNVNSAWYALESMSKSVIWIAGGVDKGNDYDALKPLVKEKVRMIITLGKDNSKIHQAFHKDVDMIISAESAEQAVNLALNLGFNGEVALLSPACASFDLFENYQDRGNQFKMAVRSL